MGKTRKRERVEGEKFTKRLVCDTCGIGIDYESAFYNDIGDTLCYKCKQIQDDEFNRQFILDEYDLEPSDYDYEDEENW
jgi:hypothetical protein